MSPWYIYHHIPMCQDMNKTVNWTLDEDTHRLLGVVSKSNGITKIGMLRSLIVNEAQGLGKKIPKSLKGYAY